jgi:hypothetical protein
MTPKEAKDINDDVTGSFFVISGAGLNKENIPSAITYDGVKPLKNNKINKTNVVDILESSLEEFLWESNPYGNVEVKCALEFGNIIFKFETGDLAQKAFYSIKGNSPQNVSDNIACVSYEAEHAIIIPGAVRWEFLSKCFGFNDIKFSNSIRDIGTVQRAVASNRLDKIDVVDKDPRHNQISGYALKQAIGPSKITSPYYESEVLLRGMPWVWKDEGVVPLKWDEYNLATILKSEMESESEFKNYDKAKKGYYSLTDACYTRMQVIALIAKTFSKCKTKNADLEGPVLEILNRTDEACIDRMFNEMLNLVKENSGKIQPNLEQIVKLIDNDQKLTCLKERMKVMINLNAECYLPEQEGGRVQDNEVESLIFKRIRDSLNKEDVKAEAKEEDGEWVNRLKNIINSGIRR